MHFTPIVAVALLSLSTAQAVPINQQRDTLGLFTTGSNAAIGSEPPCPPDQQGPSIVANTEPKKDDSALGFNPIAITSGNSGNADILSPDCHGCNPGGLPNNDALLNIHLDNAGNLKIGDSKDGSSGDGLGSLPLIPSMDDESSPFKLGGQKNNAGLPPMGDDGSSTGGGNDDDGTTLNIHTPGGTPQASITPIDGMTVNLNPSDGDGSSATGDGDDTLGNFGGFKNNAGLPPSGNEDATPAPTPTDDSSNDGGGAPAEAQPAPAADASPEPAPEAEQQPAPAPEPEQAAPAPAAEEPTPTDNGGDANANGEDSSQPEPAPSPEAQQPEPSPAAASPSPEPEPAPSPSPAPSEEAAPSPSPSPEPAPSPSPSPSPEAAPAPSPSPSPSPESTTPPPSGQNDSANPPPPSSSDDSSSPSTDDDDYGLPRPQKNNAGLPPPLDGSTPPFGSGVIPCPQDLSSALNAHGEVDAQPNAHACIDLGLPFLMPEGYSICPDAESNYVNTHAETSKDTFLGKIVRLCLDGGLLPTNILG